MAIFFILNDIYVYKNRVFGEGLERIRALYANRDGHLYICVAFKEPHSEKQKRARKVIFRIVPIFLAQESYTSRSSYTWRQSYTRRNC